MFLIQIELEKKVANMTQKEGCVLIFKKDCVSVCLQTNHALKY